MEFIIKVHVAIFIYFATHAINLEIVTKLTSQAFIETLDVFARRGKIESFSNSTKKNS